MTDKESTKMQIDTAREAVDFTKKSKQVNGEPEIDLEEIEAMLESAM